MCHPGLCQPPAAGTPSQGVSSRVRTVYLQKEREVDVGMERGVRDMQGAGECGRWARPRAKRSSWIKVIGTWRTWFRGMHLPPGTLGTANKDAQIQVNDR